MDDDMDTFIGQLARRATHPGLVGVDAAVLARIATERIARARSWRLDMIAMAGALALGIGGASTLAAPVPHHTLFNEASRLAPSTLLEGDR